MYAFPPGSTANDSHNYVNDVMHHHLDLLTGPKSPGDRCVCIAVSVTVCVALCVHFVIYNNLDLLTGPKSPIDRCLCVSVYVASVRGSVCVVCDASISGPAHRPQIAR